MSPIVRLALPVLAAAGSAYAACSASGGTATIQNSGDATAFASCSTFSGSIAIETGATGPIAIDGIKKLDGNLIARNNSNIEVISANDLEEIGTFELNELSKLHTVTFPKLKTVDKLSWIGLPVLQNLGFTEKITQASEINIQNTELQSLEGIDLEKADTVYIANNPYISEIAMQVESIGTSLILEGNNAEVNVTFPNLIWAFNMTFRNCSSVEVASLESLNGSLGMYGNVFSDFKAPNLTEIGGALAIVSNTELTNISFPELTDVGFNLEVANNTKLRELTGFPKLKSINGALDFNGNMTKVDLPALNYVKGAFNIQSTGDIQKTCDDVFKPLESKDKIKGDYKCVGSVEKPGGEGTTPTQTAGNAKKTGAAVAISVENSALLAGLAAAFFL